MRQADGRLRQSGSKNLVMFNDPLAKKLNPFFKKIQEFQQHYSAFRVDLQSKLREMVINIRSGLDNVSSFKQLLTHISSETFTFNSNRLSQWWSMARRETRRTLRNAEDSQSINRPSNRFDR